MALNDREIGSDLSSIERELIKREDAGYVRYYPGTKGKVFFLDLSPFKHRNESVVFITNENIPAEKTLIEVSIDKVQKEIIGSYPNFQNMTFMYIDNWKSIDSNLFTKKSLISKDDFLDFFCMQYHGTEDAINTVVNGLALFMLSNPPTTDRLGGIETGVFSNKKEWSGFKQATGIIPIEFKKPSSKYYYQITEQETLIPAGKYEELNNATSHPDYPIHFPIVMIKDEIIRKTGMGKKNVVDKIGIDCTSFILDAVLTTPIIPASLEKTIYDKLYELVNDYKSMGKYTYIQDFDQIIPRMSLGLARLNSKEEVTSNLIKQGFELWLDMAFSAQKISDAPLPPGSIFNLFPDEIRIYTELNHAFGIDTPISMEEGFSTLNKCDIIKNYSREKILEAIDTMNTHGMLFKKQNGDIQLLDLR